MHGDSFAEASDTTDLDIDDAAGLHGDGCERVTAIADGFIEAYGGLEALLQQGVEVEVVPPERLLDHEQVETVPVGDVFQVLHPIDGVGVTAEGDIGPALAYGFEDVGIPTGLAFEFDALVARS